jgi:hypothetical protein
MAKITKTCIKILINVIIIINYMGKMTKKWKESQTNKYSLIARSKVTITDNKILRRKYRT